MKSTSAPCLDSSYSYMGAEVRVTVYTITAELCNEVKQILSKGYEAAIEMIKRYGCAIESEQPLRISVRGGDVEIVIEPKNLIARMFWREAVNMVKGYCKQ